MIDLVAHGFACDHLSEGYQLLSVRSVRSKEVPDVTDYPAHPGQAYKHKPFSMRIALKIDIMMEPLSPTSVRFCYQVCGGVRRET